MNWKQYQDETAEFFRGLGCDADVDVKVAGVRAEHKVDVWVRFRRFGFETKWVIECKYWKSAVPKEKVLALKSIVEDVGADRGLLLSAAGFQSGAIRASEKTNITLTDLDGLKETTRGDLISSLLHSLETRAIKVKYDLHDLFAPKRQVGTDGYQGLSKEIIREPLYFQTIGALCVLEWGFDEIRLEKPPYSIKFDDTGRQLVVVETVEEFVAEASKIIQEAEIKLASLRSAQSK